MKLIIIVVLGWALVFLGAGIMALPASLGAHPWWAQSVVWIGTAVGLACALTLRAVFRPAFPIVLILALTTVGFGALINVGKTRFAASFAEDAVAGRMWHWGWIALIAALFALVVFVSLQLFERRK